MEELKFNDHLILLEKERTRAILVVNNLDVVEKDRIRAIIDVNDLDVVVVLAVIIHSIIDIIEAKRRRLN